MTSGVTKLSISRFRILAVSEMIDVDVLIAPLISSSKSTVSRNAVAEAPDPFPPVITTFGAVVYPLPGLLIAIFTTLPLKINADASACVPPAVAGGSIVTEGTNVYPEPPLSILMLLAP